jgi:hypothetical protein
MVSHKKLGGSRGLSVSLDGGLRFTKRSSGYNACIGRALKGGVGPVDGGRKDKNWQAKFTQAAKSCAGKLGKVV